MNENIRALHETLYSLFRNSEYDKNDILNHYRKNGFQSFYGINGAGIIRLCRGGGVGVSIRFLPNTIY